MIDKAACSVAGSQSFPSSPTVIAQWAHDQSDQRGDEERGYVIWDQKNEFLLNKAHLTRALPATETNIESLTCPPGAISL